MTRSANRLALAVALAALVFAGGSAAGQGKDEFGLQTTVPMPEGEKVEAAALADLDGDGARDLVVATHVLGKAYDRRLHLYFRREGKIAFPPQPDRSRPLEPDVVAFAPGDLDPAPGDEIVLFAATGAFVWRTGGGERDLPSRAASTDFLWQLAHPREAFLFADGVRDVDGDGLPDLMLPEPGGYRIVFQDRGEKGSVFDRSAFLAVPEYEPAGGRESVAAARERLKNLRTSLAIGESKGDDLLSVSEFLPFPVLRDWNADGRPDLFAQTTSELLVWPQGEGGAFAAAPAVRRRLPLEVDTGRRLDVSFSSHVRDLDGDGRADYVLVAGDRSSKDVRTQVLVYRRGEGALFGDDLRPDDALFIGGFGGLLDLADVDGDGRPDLVMGSVRVDALDAIRAAAKGDLDAELLVYRNHGGTFSRQPDFSLKIRIPARNVQQAGKSVTARFLGDLTGTGTSDLLLRDDPERIQLLAVVRRGDRIQAFPRPLFETRIDKKAKLRIEDRGGPPELLVLESGRVLHVRFAR